MTITDEVSEMALTFGVAVNDDDTLTLDMGDLGTVSYTHLYPMSVAEIRQIR